MPDQETGRSIYQRAIEAVDGLGPTSSPIDGVRVIVELAHVEAIRINADSQRLLAETMVEANRLKRIELGMAEPGDHTLVGASGEGFTADDSAAGVSGGSGIYKAPELPRTDRPSADSMQSTPPITGL